MKVVTIPNPAEATRPTESTVELQEQVRRRAYELYENRGREDGHDVDDWLQAEWEVVAELEVEAA